MATPLKLVGNGLYPRLKPIPVQRLKDDLQVWAGFSTQGEQRKNSHLRSDSQQFRDRRQMKL
jgi:hypothetical protein